MSMHQVRDEVLPQHTKELAMVVHKDVTKTHEKGNAHDANIMVVPVKEKAKGMVTYFGMLAFLQGTWRSTNKLAFKPNLKKVT
jgi:hypothetical protein